MRCASTKAVFSGKARRSGEAIARVLVPAPTTNQPEAAVFNFDKARIFTRMLAGLAAPLTISPVAGLRTKVPALRAGTLRSVTFNRPGKVNSPTPRGCTDPSNTLSSVAKTPKAVLRGMSFWSAIRLISAALVVRAPACDRDSSVSVRVVPATVNRHRRATHGCQVKSSTFGADRHSCPRRFTNGALRDEGRPI